MTKFPVLGITSPATKGSAVTKAQKALKTNAFGDFLRKGKVDGEYGPLTGAAVHRAKYYLGYPTSGVNKTYNYFIHEYLTGERKLTKLMLARRKYRLSQAAKKADKNTTMRKRFVEAALKYDGVKENPSGSNKVLFSDWYGMRGPWCAMYLSFLLAVILKVTFWKYAYCPYILQDAMKNKSNMFVIHPDEAGPGDIWVVDWNYNGEVDHTGLNRTKLNSLGRFGTVEGNTAIGNNSNGGQVMQRDRNKADGKFTFIRINFA